eukprot:355351-Chlamydomonas_euryale.AAC.1
MDGRMSARTETNTRLREWQPVAGMRKRSLARAFDPCRQVTERRDATPHATTHVVAHVTGAKPSSGRPLQRGWHSHAAAAAVAQRARRFPDARRFLRELYHLWRRHTQVYPASYAHLHSDLAPGALTAAPPDADHQVRARAPFPGHCRPCCSAAPPRQQWRQPLDQCRHQHQQTQERPLAHQPTIAAPLTAAAPAACRQRNAAPGDAPATAGLGSMAAVGCCRDTVAAASAMPTDASLSMRVPAPFLPALQPHSWAPHSGLRLLRQRRGRAPALSVAAAAWRRPAGSLASLVGSPCHKSSQTAQQQGVADRLQSYDSWCAKQAAHMQLPLAAPSWRGCPQQGPEQCRRRHAAHALAQPARQSPPERPGSRLRPVAVSGFGQAPPWQWTGDGCCPIAVPTRRKSLTRQTTQAVAQHNAVRDDGGRRETAPGDVAVAVAAAAIDDNSLLLLNFLLLAGLGNRAARSRCGPLAGCSRVATRALAPAGCLSCWSTGSNAAAGCYLRRPWRKGPRGRRRRRRWRAARRCELVSGLGCCARGRVRVNIADGSTSSTAAGRSTRGWQERPEDSALGTFAACGRTLDFVR